jgi:hypothetical protein
MAVTQITPNMGRTDRIVRGTLGGWMLLNGLAHLAGGGWWRRIESLVGGAFLVYGITGFDPLLKRFGASTIPGTENNIMNQIKHAAPGQGINPMLTQQAVPQQDLPANLEQQVSIAEQTRVK